MLTFAIVAPTDKGPWTMRVTNGGDEPVRIAADARLLTLEVTPRGSRTPTRCELPDDMRPSTDFERALVVPPARSYVETFEPRLFCFGADRFDALAPGAIVVAKLGWPSGSPGEAPFEVSSVEGAKPGIAPKKAIEAPPIALPDEPTAWPPAPGPIATDEDTPRFSLLSSTAVDAATTNDIGIALTLRNDGTHAAAVRFRPESIDFRIVGRGVSESCAWPMVPAAPLREMFTTFAPGQKETLEVTLSSYCMGHALDRAGLFVVWPRLDTRDASGAAIGLRTFNGLVTGSTPTVVRLHRGTARQQPVKPPRLEEP